jgi:hypothetical protein
MVAEELFVHKMLEFSSFYPSQKRNFQGTRVPYLIKLSGAGAGRSRNSYLQLRGARAERNIFVSTTLLCRQKHFCLILVPLSKIGF